MNVSLKSLLAISALLAAPAALANSTTTIPLFDSKIATARTSTSPGGTTVVRSEMIDALNSFLGDDSLVDSTERAYIGTKVNDATFNTGVTGQAKKFLTDFYELNDAATTSAPLGMSPVADTPATCYGANGALAYVSAIQEGYIPNGQGVANQYTLQYTYYSNFQSTGVGNFTPINLHELTNMLSQHVESGTPSLDEVDGAVHYINMISRNSFRIYVASWISNGRGGPGDLGGFVVAAVSTDRRFVRFVEVRTWAE